MSIGRNLVTALLALALPGCLASSMSSGESLQTALDHYTDAVRWGRATSALTHVDPRLRRSVQRRHLAWARLVRIAEASVMDVAHDDPHHRARVLLQVTWYRDSDPILRTTTLEQTWRDRDDWLLVQENVADGDEALFAMGRPERARAEVRDPEPAAAPRVHAASAVPSRTRALRAPERREDDAEDDEGWQ